MPAFLTDAMLKALDVRPERYELSDGGQPGLRLRVTASGARVWSYWYRNAAGAPRRIRIGDYPETGLSVARKRARKHAAAVDGGEDPAGARAEARAQRAARAAAGTFAEICDDFVTDQAADWRPATKASWVRYIEREIKPSIGQKRPQDVTSDDVASLIAGITKRAPVSAQRAFEVLRRACAWAVWKKRLPLSPCDQARPFRARQKRARGARRAKAYSDEQLRAIFAAARGTDAEDLLALVAFTAVRAHEARSARWVDFERGVWRVPAEAHKVGEVTGEPHLVPLSAQALGVLKVLRKRSLAEGSAASPWCLPAPTGPCEVCAKEGHAGKPSKTFAAIKAAAGIEDRGLLHRFRDTIKTRMSEHGIPPNVSEHVLGHVVPGISGRYDHAELLPQRREALAWWGAELARIIGPRRARVVSIATGRA